MASGDGKISDINETPKISQKVGNNRFTPTLMRRIEASPRSEILEGTQVVQALSRLNWQSDSHQNTEHGDDTPVTSNQQELQRPQQSKEIDTGKQQATDIHKKKPSPLDTIKTLGELLELIPPKYHGTIINADQRARKASDTASRKERKEPKELVNFVKKYYKVSSKEKLRSIEYSFESKWYEQDNHASINIDPDKGIINSGLANRNHKDQVHFSDLQRYACITDDEKEIPINEYQSRLIINKNTLEIVKALCHASKELSSSEVTDDNLNLTSKSAAFIPFLGADINLSKIFLARDLGLNIQSVAIQSTDSGVVTFQLKFAPAGQN